jgi:hypothetical protein
VKASFRSETAKPKLERPWRAIEVRRFFLFLLLSLSTSTSSTSSLQKLHHTLQQKELKEIDRDKASGVTVTIKGGSLKKLTGYVEGEERERVDWRKKKNEGKAGFSPKEAKQTQPFFVFFFSSFLRIKQAPRTPLTRRAFSLSTSSSVRSGVLDKEEERGFFDRERETNTKTTKQFPHLFFSFPLFSLAFPPKFPQTTNTPSCPPR